MTVTLKRHRHPMYPDWVIVNEDVPLGTEYQVLGFYQNVTMLDLDKGREIILDCYLIEGNGSLGLMPICVFEILH